MIVGNDCQLARVIRLGNRLQSLHRRRIISESILSQRHAPARECGKREFGELVQHDLIAFDGLAKPLGDLGFFAERVGWLDGSGPDVGILGHAEQHGGQERALGEGLLELRADLIGDIELTGEVQRGGSPLQELLVPFGSVVLLERRFIGGRRLRELLRQLLIVAQFEHDFGAAQFGVGILRDELVRSIRRLRQAGDCGGEGRRVRRGLSRIGRSQLSTPEPQQHSITELRMRHQRLQNLDRGRELSQLDLTHARSPLSLRQQG